MRRTLLTGLFLFAVMPSIALAQEEGGVSASYSIVSTTKVGGAGGWGTLYADADARRLYIPRTGQQARIAVLDLDSLKQVGTVGGVDARAVAIDAKSGHGFSASKPVTMWDTKTLKPIKTIAVEGEPSSILADAFNNRIYVLSKSSGNATVLNAADGSVLGTIALDGMPEQAVSDDQGHVFIALTDKDQIAVVDAAAMKVTDHWDLDGVGASPTAMAIDKKDSVLLVGCRNETMVYMNSKTGEFLYGLPVGTGINSVAFNPNTNELFSAQDDGTFTIAEVAGPTRFNMGGTIVIPTGAPNLALDAKTGKIYVATAEFSGDAKPVSFYDLPDHGAASGDTFAIITIAK